MAATHNPDMVLCRKAVGPKVGRVCGRCEGRCVVCDSMAKMHVKAHICEECAYGSGVDQCVVCGTKAVADAEICYECYQQEKDRDGCPKVLNMGSKRMDRYFQAKKQNFVAHV